MTHKQEAYMKKKRRNYINCSYQHNSCNIYYSAGIYGFYIIETKVGSFAGYYIIDWFQSTTENYERAWNAFPFARYMFNSIFVGLATTALTVFTSAMAAYAFARLKFKGRDKVFFVYLSTLMVPIQVTIIPLYMDITYIGMA